MKRISSAVFVWAALTSTSAFATCTQPSGVYNGASAGIFYWNGSAAAVHDFAWVLNFTGANQGAILQIGRGMTLNGASTPVTTKLTWTFPAPGSPALWYPQYCGGEFTMVNTTANPPPTAPLTETFAYTVSDSGKVITLTYLSATYANNIPDYFVPGFVIRLEQP